MTFLGLTGRTIVVFGVTNRKSVGFVAGRLLDSEGARILYVARNEERRRALAKILPEGDILTCDVEKRGEVERISAELRARADRIDGFLHAIAHARYGELATPFHETSKDDFLNAMQVSCHSFIELSNALRPILHEEASVVTVSISSTTMAAENYGYMAPVKAALDSAVVFLAKSFSTFSKVRFNAVSPGLLKTSASAGIPGYVDSYLFAEQATLRKKNVATEEVASTIAFLLSPRSSGINAQRIVVDAGMASNYFDREIVRRVNRL